MLQNIGLPEILIILLMLLVFFGPKYLTELAQHLGKSGRELKNINKEFKEAVKEVSDEDSDAEKPVKKQSKKKGGEQT